MPSTGSGTEDLAAVRDGVFALLSAALTDRASPYRLPTFATVWEGQPRQRTVVLRTFDPGALSLSVHTDLRAGKVRELRENPAAALHVWDGRAQVQVRLQGPAALHYADDVAAQAWAALDPKTRGTYALSPASGSVIERADAYVGPDATSGTAHGNFAVITVDLHGLEWLCLAGPKHRRARFSWHGGREEACWLVP